jgi:ABC-type Fe3+ transport system substrate-binding protein
MAFSGTTDQLLKRTLAGLVQAYPAASGLLADHGLGILTEPGNLEAYGPVLRLGTVLRSRGIDPDAFCAQLVPSAATPVATPGEASLNLLALLPCPLKVPLEEAFLDFLEKLPPQRRAAITFRIEGNANAQLDYADFADHFESADEVPDIVITPGFNSFFHRPFVERFIKTDRFRNVCEHPGDRNLAPLGLSDPDGHYTMLAMNLLVLVVHRTRLGSRTPLAGWADLLKPELEKSIAIRGNRDGTFCETLLLTMYRKFGSEGLQQLGRNVRYGWHPSQMVKSVLQGGEDAPAVSVMPLFFANNIRSREQIDIVWPEDGALVSPVTMLVKQEKRQDLADLVDFLAGPEVARICAGAFFPTLHPEVDNRLPEKAGFTWIGWDFVKDHDLKEMIERTNATFAAAFREGES